MSINGPGEWPVCGNPYITITQTDEEMGEIPHFVSVKCGQLKVMFGQYAIPGNFGRGVAFHQLFA
jgi:hypothetical protein